MDELEIITALTALAQTTRLQAFKLLVTHEPNGLASGELARQLEVPHNTMWTHLAILTRTGLISGERQSRTITYRANISRFRDIALYLLRDCCGGRPDACVPLMSDLIPCCKPKETA